MRTRHRNRRAGIFCSALLGLVGCLFVMTGCGGDRIDPNVFHKGMHRSAIIARLGAPDAVKRHDDVERLTYKDGEHYKYLLLLDDGKLTVWRHDRVYKKSRFSTIRSGLDVGR